MDGDDPAGTHQRRPPARLRAATSAAVLAPVALAAATAVLYAAGIGSAPVYLSHDEVFFAVNGMSIAATGRDINNRLLPLYVEISRLHLQVPQTMWFHPVLIYASALLHLVLPPSEASVRLPSV